MNKKEDFLAIKSYKEFDRRREEFKGLTLKDPEVRRHFSDIFPRLKSYTEEELYSYLPDGRRVLGGKGNTKKPDTKVSEEKNNE